RARATRRAAGWCWTYSEANGGVSTMRHANESAEARGSAFCDGDNRSGEGPAPGGAVGAVQPGGDLIADLADVEQLPQLEQHPHAAPAVGAAEVERAGDLAGGEADRVL